MKPTVLLLSVCCFSVPAFGDEIAFPELSPGTNEVSIEHDGYTRRALIALPEDTSRDTTYPVIFCFHGAGGKADGMSRRWNPHVNERGIVVVSVEAIQPLAKWNFLDGFHVVDHDDVGLVTQIAKKLISIGLANPQSLYATGHSSGGLFCYRLAKESPLLAAVAPMSCGMVADGHEPSKQTTALSLIQVIGDEDKSYHGSSNPKVTMYSSKKRIEVWKAFLKCEDNAKERTYGDEISYRKYQNPSGDEVAICEVRGQGHFIRQDLRNRCDSIALDFMLRHQLVESSAKERDSQTPK